MKELVVGILIGVYLLAPLYLQIVLAATKNQRHHQFHYIPFLTIKLIRFTFGSMQGSDSSSSLFKKIRNRVHAVMGMLKESRQELHKNRKVFYQSIRYHISFIIKVGVMYPIRCLQYAMWYLQDHANAGININYLLFDNLYNTDSSKDRQGG